MARLSTAALAAVLIAGAAATPALAQQDETPAPTPAPSATSPSTFRLPSTNDGRTTGMQGPADNGIPPLAPGERRGTPAPTPAPAPTKDAALAEFLATPGLLAWAKASHVRMNHTAAEAVLTLMKAEGAA